MWPKAENIFFLFGSHLSFFSFFRNWGSFKSCLACVAKQTGFQWQDFTFFPSQAPPDFFVPWELLGLLSWFQPCVGSNSSQSAWNCTYGLVGSPLFPVFLTGTGALPLHLDPSCVWALWSDVENKRLDTKGGKWWRGGGGGGVMKWEIGIDIYTLICIKWITNKNLLYKK